MAITMYREPINHGDSNAWFDYLMSSVRQGGIGGLSMELSNVAGALSLSPGYAGIDDGVVKGSIKNDAALLVSLAAIGNSHWCTIELSVAGAVVTLSVTQMADADESLIPATIKAAYDPTKQGYYLTVSHRLIGIAYKSSTGTLGRIVNCESGKLGFKAVQIRDYRNAAGVRSKKYYDKIVMEIGPWNMDVTVNLTVTHNLALLRIVSVFVAILDDMGSSIDMTVNSRSTAPSGATGGAAELIYNITLPNSVNLSRATGGSYDSASYDDAVMNRGYITIEYET